MLSTATRTKLDDAALEEIEKRCSKCRGSDFNASTWDDIVFDNDNANDDDDDDNDNGDDDDDDNNTLPLKSRSSVVRKRKYTLAPSSEDESGAQATISYSMKRLKVAGTINLFRHVIKLFFYGFDHSSTSFTCGW